MTNDCVGLAYSLWGPSRFILVHITEAIIASKLEYRNTVDVATSLTVF